MRAQIARYGTAEAGWEVAMRPPAPFLAPYVVELMGYTQRSPVPVVRRELPPPAVVVIFDLGPPIGLYDRSGERSVYPRGFVAGLDDGATVTEHGGVSSGIQLNMTPLGARRLFGIPMSELARRVVDFDDLVPDQARLTDRMRALSGWDARFDLLERVVCARMAAAPEPSRVVEWAVRRITATGGNLDIAALVRELGYSPKHVIRLFHEHVGLAPKLFARIVRFDRLMRYLRYGGHGTWADLALRFGYYDQAHLVREARQLTGVTPTEARETLLDLSAFSGQVNSVQDGRAGGP